MTVIDRAELAKETGAIAGASEENIQSTLAALKEKIIVLREIAPDADTGNARGPRVPPMSARKRRRRHVRDQRRANR